MIRFVDDHRETYGVEPICAVIAMAPSTYYEAKARLADPTKQPRRAQRDAELRARLRAVWEANRGVYGVRKVWHHVRRDDATVSRRVVARLMRAEGLAGACRGRRPRTTVPATVPDTRPDLVQRQFVAERPNQLWVADFTYVSTWRGFAYVAFVIDVFSRRIVGWRVSSHMRSDLALDALEQALHDRETDDGLIHHSDRGSQYLSIAYTERLADAGLEASVGSRGDSYDNALAETIIGLFKTEEIHRNGPWRSIEAVEFATLSWVAWYNSVRLMEPLGYLSPAEFEAQFAARPLPELAEVGLN
jgi:transposase InsO family protein